jgi:hypothetical protein
MMRCLVLATALALTISLIACGGSPHPASANGSWSAVLSTSAGQQPETFTFNLTQNDVTLLANSVTFSGVDNLSSCFGMATTLSGSLSSAVNGGPMTMTLSGTPPGGIALNTITMQGDMASGMTSGSGTFTLTGQTLGCTSQSGTFAMTRAPAHSMATNP